MTVSSNRLAPEHRNRISFHSIAPEKGLAYVDATVPVRVAEEMQDRFETGRASYGDAEFDTYDSEVDGLVVVVARVQRHVAQYFASIFSERCAATW